MPDRNDDRVPMWVTITVILTVLVLLAYSVLILGERGYPITVVLAGLLGAYAGLRELFNRRGDGG